MGRKPMRALRNGGIFGVATRLCLSIWRQAQLRTQFVDRVTQLGYFGFEPFDALYADAGRVRVRVRVRIGRRWATT